MESAFDQLQGDLQFLKEDIHAVEKQQSEMLNAKEKFGMKIRMLGGGPSSRLDMLAVGENRTKVGATSQTRGSRGGASAPASLAPSHPLRQGEFRGQGTTFSNFDKEMLGDRAQPSNCQCPSQSAQPSLAGLTVAKKRRVLQEVRYLDVWPVRFLSEEHVRGLFCC